MPCKILNSIFFAVCYLFITTGHSAADVDKKGILEVIEPTYSFGTVDEGAKVTHEFQLKNSGTGDITIQRIAPSCGCTIASTSSNQIKAGETGTIKVEFDTSGFTGDKVKTVQLFTSDLDNPQVALTIKGAILPGATLDPLRLDFGEVAPGSDDSEWVKDFTVDISSGSDLKIDEVKSYSKFITVAKKSTEEKQAVYSVTLDRSIPRGPLRDRVVVSLSGGKKVTLNVPIIAFIRGDLKVSPSTVSFGVIEGTGLVERSVRLDNAGTSPIKVLSIESDSSAIKPILKEIQPGKAYVIDIKLDPTKVEHDLRAVIKVTTDKETENLLSFNVFGVLPPKR